MRIGGCTLVWLAASGCVASPAPEPQEPATVIRLQPVSPAVVEEQAPIAAAPVAGTPAPLQLGGVRPGMSLADLHAALGEQASARPFDAVKSQWESSGYDTAHQIEFLVGFDAALTYNEQGARTRLPFWTILARDGRVTLMKLTMYIPGTGPVEEAGFEPSCFLNHDESGIEQTFGSSYVLVEDPARGHAIYHYLGRGISVLAKDSRIAVLNIYAPIPAERRAQIARALRGEAETN